ncbi:NAD(P)H-binding protein [Mobilicoccus caccae]|uniref:NAD(P)-binding domain-containing protein n=1 Tax=Mobilicoccus caccae TaxID=1859295 RepID=A0ABQ6IXY4_9MICO|nr:NAD(P)H-binding protein [Mobilicoccus caccae]GMA41572.1 hypothetical protein GCM10025883_36170 [Mobilicoccus caccae]
MTDSPTSRSAAEQLPIALVTGVTGYVGGELVRPLLDAGWRVRALTRSASKLVDAPWRDEIDVVEGDATNAADLDDALRGIDVAYYLLHSMDSDGDFERRDLDLAQTFAAAAERAGISRIVYLGGLHPEGVELSLTCGRGSRSGRSSSTPPCPRCVCRRRSCWGRGRRVSRCCTTSATGCR